MQNPPLHIVHVCAARSWRGGERQLTLLVEELAKKGVQQTLLCARGSEMEKWCRGKTCRFFTYRKIFSLNPLAAWRIEQICRGQKITHVHANDSHAHSFAVLAASLFGVKAKIIVHRRVDFPIGETIFSKWKYNHPAVYRIICVSDFIKNLIAPALSDPSKIRVIYEGVDLGEFPAPIPPSPITHPSSPFTIGNIAAIAPHKDYFTFVHTAEILLYGGLTAKFKIIGGDGGEERAIRALISKKKLAGQIELTGFRTDALKLLCELDVLLFTSKTEGLGTTLLDAMAAGVPIVATRAGGIPEIVEDGVTGLLAPVGDAEKLAAQVLRMLGDAPLRAVILANAREKATLFSKERMAAAVLEIYG